MDRTSDKAFWSLALFFGWLLGFPLHGPLLGAMAAAREIDAQSVALTFTLSHAIGLLACGVIARERWWRSLLKWGSLGTLLLGAAIPLVNPAWWSPWMVSLGLTSAAFVVGWSRPYVASVTVNRAAFMATLILTSNAILYLLNLLTVWVSWRLAFLLATLSLAAVFVITRRIKAGEPVEPVALDKQTGFPLQLVAIACLLVFGLCLNGGLMYSAVFPAFAKFARFDSYFGLIPYMVALVVIRYAKVQPRVLVYLGPPLLGLGFVVFAEGGVSFAGYLAAETLILASLACADVLLWSLLGEIGGLYGRPFLIFGLGLTSNVAALFAGGSIGARLMQLGPAGPIATGLFAAATIFAVMTLVPVLLARMEQDLVGRVRQARTPIVKTGDAPLPVPDIGACLPKVETLTERELEILALIIDGHTNVAIARSLFISENTSKVHTKNIYRKLGVSGKHELLSILIKSYGEAERQVAAASNPE